MAELLLGIDVGTGSCKCCLLDSAGNVVGRSVQEYSPHQPRPGWVEQDPADWYGAVIACLRRLGQEAGTASSEIAAVGTTGQMRGATFLDAAGSPVRPSILWNDLRCTEEVAELQAASGELLRRVTWNPINTMCTLPKLLWVLRHEPQTWERTARLIYPKDYVNFRLTGALATDLSDASGSSFYDLRQQRWSGEILGAFGLDRGKLPQIVPATEIVGRVSAQAQLETGLREGVPVVAGGSDATVELLAIGLEGERQCKVRLGTSGALSTLVDRLGPLGAGQAHCWSYLLPGRWMIDINTRTCADATVWLKELFYRDAPDSSSAYQQIAQEAAGAPAGADGLFFHPYLLGEDAPYWQPHLRASFVGLTRAHGRAHCARAVLEGTAFALRDAHRALGDLAAGFEEYVFVGGGTKNAVWLGIVADVLGVDGRVSANTDAAVGAAMLAGVGSGAFEDLHHAVALCSRVTGSIRHSPQNHARYNALFERYRSIKQTLDALYDGTRPPRAELPAGNAGADDEDRRRS